MSLIYPTARVLTTSHHFLHLEPNHQVTLDAGESSELTFNIRSHQLTSGDAHGNRVATKGAWKVWAGAGNEGAAATIVLV